MSRLNAPGQSVVDEVWRTRMHGGGAFDPQQCAPRPAQAAAAAAARLHPAEGLVPLTVLGAIPV